MLQRSIGFGLALTCMAMLGLGCGDDDSAPDGGANAGNGGDGSGESGSRPSTGGRSGSSGSNPRPGRPDAGMNMSMADAGFDTEFEGDPCGSTADCMGNLRCVSAGRDFQFGVCARPCTTNSDCGTEACLSLSGLQADLHCVNFERDEFAECGSLVTAACAEPRVCLGTSNLLPIGVCVNFCAIQGMDADAGAIPLQQCKAEQTCEDLDTTVDSPGFCVGHHARNDTCAPDLTDGKLCPLTDICAPIDPTVDDVTDFRCREDCTESNTCAAGTCTDVQGEFAYCIE